MDILTHAAKFVREQKNYRRWLAVVLCLALIVSIGTFVILRERGSAMTHKRRVLDCHAAVHEHSDECWGDDGELVCGLADFVLHKHNDDCFDEAGELVCTLPEIKEHSHTDECYKEEKVTVCTLEESEGHVHNDGCYGEDGALTCEVVNGEGAHSHGDECFEMQKTLVCELPEAVLHTHVKAEDTSAAGSESSGENADESVSADESAEPDTGCYDSDGKLVCGLLQLEEHIHGKDCFKIVELSAEEVDAMNEAGHVHNKGCYDSNGERICGFEDNEAMPDGDAAKKYDYTRVFTGEDFTAAVMYNAGADFPKDAVLGVEKITADSDAEHFGERAAEFKTIADDENAEVLALLKLSMTANGEELIPKEPVRVSVSFTGDNIPEDATPTLAVRFADEGSELIQSGDVKDSAVSFDVNGLSEIAVGVDAKTEADRKNENTEIIALDETFEYTDDSFTVVFNIEGDAAARGDELGEGDEKLQVVVEPLDKKSDEYAAAAEVYGEGDGEDMIALQLLSYSVELGGVKLDISDCKVTAEVKPTDELAAQIKALDLDSADGTEIKAVLSAVEFSGEEAAEADKTDEAQIVAETEPADDTTDTSDETEPAESGEETDAPEDTTAPEDSNEPEESKESDAPNAEIIDAKEFDIENLSAPMVFSLRAAGTDGVVAFSAGATANPHFTVKYTAPLKTIDFKGKAENGYNWPVIDTSGKNMPKNNQDPARKYIKLDSNGRVVTVNSGENTEIYKSEQCQYIKSPGIVYINKLSGNSSYKLVTMKIKDGDKVTSYPLNGGQTYHFTNKTASAAGGNYILIKEGMEIELVYETVTVNNTENETAFYDYDVTDGKLYQYDTSSNKYTEVTQNRPSVPNTSRYYYMMAYEKGINSYGTTYGFGNSEGALNSGKGNYEWNQFYYGWNGSAKKWNFNNITTGGAYFGIAKQLKIEGNNKTIIFNNALTDRVTGNKLTVPNLFDGSKINGKTSYDGKLIFKQVGDMYTLTGSYVNDKGSETKLSNLDQLFNKRYSATRYDLYSNNFYPLDNVGSAGGTGHDLKFGANKMLIWLTPEQLKNNTYLDSTTKGKQYFRESDDGNDHNHYFGMHYTVDFELTEDYTGPMEYLFYGDDDIWIFLTSKENCNQKYNGQLICDIGGVHSSIGEYVNLRDYLPKGSSGKYTLNIYYTERGASGSTCYMQFTLPSVSFAAAEQDTGSLIIEKKVSGVLNSSEEFGFEINFKDANGESLPDNYAYTKYNKADNSPVQDEYDVLISAGSRFTLKDSEYIKIDYLPIGTKYEIKEVGAVANVERVPGEGIDWEEINSSHDYRTEINGNESENRTITGTIQNKGTETVTYNNIINFALPETGGAGTLAICITGAAVAAAAVIMLCVYERRRKRTYAGEQ